MDKKEKTYDCIIIGGGQSALATAYYLRRSKLDYLMLDKQQAPGGSWNETWDSLHLFSAAKHNALPGFPMPETEGEFPSKSEVINYLKTYEERYNFPVERTIQVNSVSKENDLFFLSTSNGTYKAKSIIAATGTYEKPFIPDIKGRDLFQGDQIHSADYRSPDTFRGKRVLIVGEGNSGAQIYAELSKHTLCFWGVKDKPEFLPPDVDGKVLFDQASEIYRAKQKGEKIDKKVFDLGNIVMVPEVKKAYDSGMMDEYHFIDHFTRNEVVWKDGSTDAIDAVIWCTGFGYNTDFLRDVVSIDGKGKTKTKGTKAQEINGLWLVGYGGWTGMASATIIGVGRTAKKTAKEVQDYIKSL